MPLPYFYLPFIDNGETLITLDEETSKHIVSVLRMQGGDRLHLTDGKGRLLTAEITDNHKKMCVVRSLESVNVPEPAHKVTIAISLLKNGSRFEWFIEKAAELGVYQIIPMLCERSEKLHFRYERKINIMVSAILQSQQAWLPILQEPKRFDEIVLHSDYQQKFIAHCLEDKKSGIASVANTLTASQIMYIGPEGDFTREELDLALKNNCIPVTLGETRLRSETAGLVAAAALLHNS